MLRVRSESFFELNSTQVQLNCNFHIRDSFTLVMVTTVEAHSVAVQWFALSLGNRDGCEKHAHHDGVFSEAV